MYRTALEAQGRASRQLCSHETKRFVSTTLVKQGESSMAARLGIPADITPDKSILPPESFGVSPKPSSASDSRSSAATEALDRLFGASLKDRTNSYYKERAANQQDGWTAKSLKELSRPSALANVTSSPIRRLRGVHQRRARAQGATPAEADMFNSILVNIFASLERKDGPLPPGSSYTDPYGATLSVGASLARARRAGRGIPRDMDEIDAKTEAEIEQLKEDLTALTTDSDVLEWAEKHILKPTIAPDGEIMYPKTYPHILAFAIRTIRVHYNNPHLALALFHHAQTVNLESYVSGCLTGVYNEILHIRWDSFRDLVGVEATVNEMDFNGLQWDKDTAQIIRTVTGSVINLWTGGIDPHDIYGPGAEELFRKLEDRLNRDIEREKIVANDKRLQNFKLDRGAHADRASPRERSPRGQGRVFGLKGEDARPSFQPKEGRERVEGKEMTSGGGDGEFGGLSRIFQASRAREDQDQKVSWRHA